MAEIALGYLVFCLLVVLLSTWFLVDIAHAKRDGVRLDT